MSASVAEAPADEAELAALIAEGGPFEIIGGGTRRGLGRPVEGAPLSTARLGRVALYEPAALTLVAGAGARLADVAALLAAEGQRLPFEPMDHRRLLGSAGEPTLGGVVACNVSGPARIVRGACRDSLIGVRFVDGLGRVVKNGGRVMKNVTGYDLVKLICGSYGTLGVLTEVAFKLLPLPETRATVRLRGLDDARAVAALSAALGSPYDVTGAAHLASDAAGASETMLRVEGFDASVRYRAEALRDALRSFGAAEIEADPARVETEWADVRDVAAFADRPGAVWRLSLKPSDGPPAVAAIRDACALDGVVYDWGGGLVWLLTPETGDAGVATVHAEASRRGGHATLVRAPDALRARVAPFHPEASAIQRLSAGIRARFDPRRVLNPGRMTA